VSPRRSDSELDALLARGRLSGAEREAVLKRVLRGTTAKQAWHRRSYWFAGGLGIAAGAALFFGVARPHDPGDGFRAKGGAAAPHLTLVCRDGQLNACPHDSKLMFRADGVTGAWYLSAFAENVASGERAWFAPAESGEATKAAIQAGDTLLDRSVGLSALPPGTYRVHARLSHEPLSRAEAASVLPASPAPAEALLTVLP